MPLLFPPRWPRALILAALLALAGFLCLLAALRLLDAPTATGPDSPVANLALRLGLMGALVIFLLGLGALLAARRLAFGRRNTEPPPGPPLPNLVEIQAWSDELASIRSGLRDGAPDDVLVETRTLEVPPAWRPDGRYTLTAENRDSATSDLKHTRDQLLEAAERVDAIVQGIRVVAATDCAPDASGASGSDRRPWWKFR